MVGPLFSVFASVNTQTSHRFSVDSEDPHPSSFKGQTPDELCAGTGDDVVAELAKARAKALQERMARNRAAHCSSCPKAA
jgi:hypothetical protein